ncbi:hypothetical protein HHK36_014024 [Tetracentron sinense]|uniref:Uncharacterized protein n=1 Tax=Tetracentron sinense TaxID=13715 RepID=A0A834Z4D6_TETSI|nr:hypothetical protein HHK36_014024 [Tetracentron sinense]
MGSATPLKLPIIDFCKEDLKPGTIFWDSKNSGCFEAVYDEVSLELHNTFFQELEKLFDLPLETKLQNTTFNLPGFGFIRQLPFQPLTSSLLMLPTLSLSFFCPQSFLLSFVSPTPLSLYRIKMYQSKTKLFMWLLCQNAVTVATDLKRSKESSGNQPTSYRVLKKLLSKADQPGVPGSIPELPICFSKF